MVDLDERSLAAVAVSDVIHRRTRNFRATSDNHIYMPRTNGQLGFIEPQLATLVDQPPQGDEWIHEIKHDGYRTLLIVQDRVTSAYTRTGLDWTDRYPVIVNATTKLNCSSAIIDGEVIVQDERGVSDFDALRSAIRWQPHNTTSPSPQSDPLAPVQRRRP